MAKKVNTGKKPRLADFEVAANKYRGNKLHIAKAFDVTRKTVQNWCNKDPRFEEAIQDGRGLLLDECLNSAYIMARGIPKDPKDMSKGWKERPDGFMLRYLIGTLGRSEGFGESIDVTSKGESIKPDPVVVEVIDRREQVAKEEE